MDFSQFPGIVADDYKRNRKKLIRFVDNAMISRGDIFNLVGEDGIEMMKINHKNHAAFMHVIFLLKKFSLLEETLPWVYRSYHNHGFSYDYFPAVLNVWIEAIETYLHPENALPVIEVYKWLINNHDKTIKLSQQKISPVYPVQKHWQIISESFFKALIGGNTYRCSEIALNSCRSEDDIPGFYLNVVQPVLYHVGDLWESGVISAASEHLATAIVSRTLSQLTFLYQPELNPAKKVMVLCPTGEYHQIGAMMVANCFEMNGWYVNFMADSMPVRDIMKHITAFQPRILAVSVTMLYNISSMIDLIQKIKSNGFENMKILAGGQAFKPVPDLPEILGIDMYAPDCIKAVSAGEQLIIQ
jgi:methanogenic corrinoid protein MtbC1